MSVQSMPMVLQDRMPGLVQCGMRSKPVPTCLHSGCQGQTRPAVRWSAVVGVAIPVSRHCLGVNISCLPSQQSQTGRAVPLHLHLAGLPLVSVLQDTGSSLCQQRPGSDMMAVFPACWGAGKAWVFCFILFLCFVFNKCFCYIFTLGSFSASLGHLPARS